MQRTSAIRAAGLWCILGGIIQLASGIVQALDPAQPGTGAFVVRNLIVTISHGFVLLGVIGLAQSGAAGTSWLSRLGLGIALLGSFLFIPFELVLLARYALGEPLLGFCAPLAGLGLTLTGIAVLRARRWRGWRRFVPLLCGLYPFLVMIPAFAAVGGPNFWAIGGWGVPLALLGMALRMEATDAQRTQPEPVTQL
jgi:hypothetical protein